MSTPSGPTSIPDAHVTLREAQNALIKAKQDMALTPDDPSKQAAVVAAEQRVTDALNGLAESVTDPSKIQVLPNGFPDLPSIGGARRRKTRGRKTKGHKAKGRSRKAKGHKTKGRKTKGRK